MAVTFNDLFNEAGGTPVALASHTPDTDSSASGWAESNGSWLVQASSGGAVEASGSTPGAPLWLATFDAGGAHGTVTANINITSGGSQGIVFRYSDTSNFWIVFISATNSQSADVVINKRDTGTFSVVSNANKALATGNHEVVIELIGNSIRVTVDGDVNNQAFASDGFLNTASRMGMRASTTTDMDVLDISFNSTASAVSITSPGRAQAYQRNGSDQSIVSITGTYVGNPTAIEYRFDGGSWTSLDASPSSNAFTGTATIGLGSGPLDVRFSNATGITDTVPNQLVGDVFVIAGQSNASGRQDNLQTHSAAQPSLLWRTGSWEILTDPTDPNTSTGSLYPLIANDYYTAESVPTAWIQTSVGATGLVDSDWDKAAGGVRYTNAIATITASGIDGITGVFWWQGERDMQQEETEAAYLTHLKDLHTNFVADSVMTASDHFFVQPLHMIVATLTGSALRNSLDAIRGAEYQAAVDVANIHILPPIYDLDTAVGGGDSIHIKTDAHAAVITDRIVTELRRVIFSRTVDTPPAVTSFVLGGGRNLVDITFDQAVAVETSYDGIRVFEDGSIITLDSVTRVSSTVIRAAFPVTSGVITVTIGSGNDPAGGDSGGGSDFPVSTGTLVMPARPYYNQTASLAVSVLNAILDNDLY